MGKSATEVRAEIEDTRQDMSETIDAIADRTSPRRIIDRRRRRGRRLAVRARAGHGPPRPRATTPGACRTRAGDGRLGGRHRSGRARRGDRADPGQSHRGRPDGLRRSLIASLVPPSEPEQQLAGALREQSQPLQDELKQAGQQVVEDVKSTARDGAGQVKQRAADAAGTVQEDVRSSTEELQNQARS